MQQRESRFAQEHRILLGVSPPNYSNKVAHKAVQGSKPAVGIGRPKMSHDVELDGSISHEAYGTRSSFQLQHAKLG